MHNAENNDENPQWIIYVLLNVHNTQCALYQLPYLVETQFFLSSMMVKKKKKFTGHNVAKHLLYHFNICTVVTVNSLI